MCQGVLLLLAFTAAANAAPDYFQIRIVDAQSGRGVPLVALRTTNHITHWTDSNGIVAWNEPGLMDRAVYFHIESPGYTFPGGGTVLDIRSGGRTELRIKRTNIAERLYRVTGQGIYRDSLLTGFPAPAPANGMVMGQDTVRAAIYKDKLFWLWGDTDRPNGPLGNFNTTAATSDLTANPDVGLDLNYFTAPDGFVKPMIPWTKRMTWMHALMPLKDPSGRERLVAYYEVVRKLGDTERSGLAVFNDEKQAFDPLVEFPTARMPGLEGNAIPVRARGRMYYYITGLRPGASVRVPADWNSVQDPSTYEHFVIEQGRGAWKRGTPPDNIQPPTRYIDLQTGENIAVHCDGISWNDYRKRWIAVLQHNNGEVWYAEADSPTGPWVYATRIADHGKYTFYWPVPHPFFNQDNGRVIYFEGTYTDAFSGNPVITPRYNYNQIMYRLALDDERLILPAPVYRLNDGRYMMRKGVAAARAWNDVADIPFFALDRARTGAIRIGNLFYAVPLSPEPPAASAAGDWDCDANGLKFTLNITDARVRLHILGREFNSGNYSGDRLTARVPLGDTVFNLTGTYRDGVLTGGWTEDGGGKFSCARPAPDPWLNSSALVPLYHYNGRYTTEAKPGARPIARVWRNPGGVALDIDALVGP